MKFSSILILLFFAISCTRKQICSDYVDSKTVVYDNLGNIICGRVTETYNGTIRLKDARLNLTFVLDSSHTYVTAYDSLGNMVWKAEPEFENVVGDRIKRRISNIYFSKSWKINPYKVLWVRSGRNAGFFDLRTGKFRLMQI